MALSELPDELVEMESGDQVEALRLFYEFKYRTIMEAATKLTQFSVFAVTVASLLTGLTFVRDLDLSQNRAVFACIIVIVGIFVVVGAAIMYGIVAGLLQVRETLKRVSPKLFQEIGLDSYIRRGVIVLSVVMAACGTGLAAIAYIVYTTIG